MDRKSKILAVIDRLKKAHPNAAIELNFNSPLELAVATILSAQCTDVKVNQVTPALFRRCRTVDDYAELPQDELEAIIRPTGFYRQKAKNIIKMAGLLRDKFNSKIPKAMDDLVSLPGIGRKTANVILGNAFNIPGFPVDTHVIRLSGRIGLTSHTDPVKIEHDLCALIPGKDWTLTSHLLIFHGRRVCPARNPKCDRCSVSDLCSFYAKAAKPESAPKRASGKNVKEKQKGKRPNGTARKQPA